MIAVTKNLKQLEELKAIHQQALESNFHWTLVWDLFTENEWFLNRLDYSARAVLTKYHFPLQWKEDVKQEALIQFARSIKRNVSLGYNSERGSFGAFLSTIIYRSCQKGLRQFRHSFCSSIDDEFKHPVVEYAQELDERIDLRECLTSLPEPFRMTVQMVCEGKSIAEIARKTQRSSRTIYRWIEKATELLRDQWQA